MRSRLARCLCRVLVHSTGQKQMKKIEIYPVGGNADESSRFGKGEWAFHSHASINGRIACGIKGHFLCWDTSIEDQSGLPTCPKCAAKVAKADYPAIDSRIRSRFIRGRDGAQRLTKTPYN
jgi:hypothetical protein